MWSLFPSLLLCLGGNSVFLVVFRFTMVYWRCVHLVLFECKCCKQVSRRYPRPQTDSRKIRLQKLRRASIATRNRRCNVFPEMAFDPVMHSLEPLKCGVPDVSSFHRTQLWLWPGIEAMISSCSKRSTWSIQVPREMWSWWVSKFGTRNYQPHHVP